MKLLGIESRRRWRASGVVAALLADAAVTDDDSNERTRRLKVRLR